MFVVSKHHLSLQIHDFKYSDEGELVRLGKRWACLLVRLSLFSELWHS